jgi:transcriptional regulator with XRE-family HTH domain
MREARYRDMGLQIKAIRERLNMTLDAMSKETGISRSYISDFERGFKLPTGKFLKHLHDRHNISLNYVFCSEGRMFRPSKEEQRNLDFGKYQEEVEELLRYLSRVPPALYAVLSFFTEYKVKNKGFIKEHYGGVEKD